MEPGTRTDLAPDGAKSSGKSADTTAKVVGLAPRKVERVRTVLDHGDEQTKMSVQSGKTTINRAYNDTQERRRRENSCVLCVRSNDAKYRTQERRTWIFSEPEK